MSRELGVQFARRAYASTLCVRAREHAVAQNSCEGSERAARRLVHVPMGRSPNPRDRQCGVVSRERRLLVHDRVDVPRRRWYPRGVRHAALIERRTQSSLIDEARVAASTACTPGMKYSLRYFSPSSQQIVTTVARKDLRGPIVARRRCWRPNSARPAAVVARQIAHLGDRVIAVHRHDSTDHFAIALVDRGTKPSAMPSILCSPVSPHWMVHDSLGSRPTMSSQGCVRERLGRRR